MENQHQKWVNAAYLGAALLVSYVLYEGAATLSSAYDLEARIKSIDLILRVASVALAGLVFLGFYLSQSVNQFMAEVADELSRVTWPSQKDTSTSTAVVIIMVIASGLALGFMDYVWTAVMKWIL